MLFVGNVLDILGLLPRNHTVERNFFVRITMKCSGRQPTTI